MLWDLGLKLKGFRIHGTGLKGAAGQIHLHSIEAGQSMWVPRLCLVYLNGLRVLLGGSVPTLIILGDFCVRFCMFKIPSLSLTVR